SIKERLRRVTALGQELQVPGVIEALLAWLPLEAASEVRGEILRLLVSPLAPRARLGQAWRDTLYRTIAFEAETPLRRLAIEGLGALAGADPEIEELLVTLLGTELDPACRRLCLEGLLTLPRLNAASIDALLAFAANAPREGRERLAELLFRLDLGVGQKGLLALLTPESPESLRRTILERLSTSPRLEEPAALRQYLEREGEPALWIKGLALLVKFPGNDPALLTSALEVMLTRGQFSAALPLMRPLLAAGVDLGAAYRLVTTNKARHTILTLALEAGQPDLLALGLRDESPWLRQQAIALAARAIDRFPAIVTPALTQVMREDPLVVLRRQSLEALLTRATLSPDLLDTFAEETDPLMRARLAQAILKIPPTPLIEAALLKAILAILDDPTFSREAGPALLARLRSFAFRADPDLEEILLRLLRRTVDFDLLALLVQRASEAVRTKHRLLPVLVAALYRFIDYYPQEPLPQILRLIEDFTGSLPALQQEIPAIVRLTGASWLLGAAAGTGVQKELLFERILAHFQAGEFERMRALLRQGFEHRLLKKSEITRLYLDALAHPALIDAVSETLLPIMKEVGLISPEIVAASLAFLVRFPVRNQAAHAVTRYLGTYGPSSLGYLNEVKRVLSPGNYRRFARLSSERRRPHDWPLWALLPDRESRAMLHQLLGEPVDEEAAPFERVQDFALARLATLPNHDVSDFEAVADLFLRLPTRGEAGAFLVRLWPEIWQRDLSPRARRAAALVFHREIRHWLARGGQHAPERVKPMPGVDLGEVRDAFGEEDEKWTAFLEGYVDLLLDRLPPAPNDRTLPPPDFAILGAGAFREVILFLVATSPPRESALWRRMLELARANYPRIFASIMEEVEETARARVLTFLQ
ncbi:MAG TPA: hypothetical protein VKT70_13270, partial [Stellaceae bacterium]|nr:hypothetical protein [Stellaceae bacterium]